ncbi:hypothetical protein M9H77_18768 [Catharanthus roseus]|uniref:Uncharacterized protein n=1 Tax=Catharanthus roseus TaxID=4058 RepID=A0ACC0B8D0_CATRO|nr:hypothetical protein M9H77_18768 [Catharanthus roseus]
MDHRPRNRELIPNNNSQDVLVAVVALHGESNEIPFLEHLLEDLTNNGVESEASRDAIGLSGIVASSPLEQFIVLPLIPMRIGNLYFSFTNPSLFMLLTLSLALLLLHFVTKTGGGIFIPIHLIYTTDNSQNLNSFTSSV